MRTLLTTVLVCSAAVAGYLVSAGSGTTNARPTEPAATDPGSAAPPAARQEDPPARLVAHEWGTFTSFSGSNGVPVGFQPNNSDLPDFVDHHDASGYSKSNRFQQGGTVSMETPVIYFYADKETRASVRVDFPKGWITEWYPHAATVPGRVGQQPKSTAPNGMGETIRWNVKLTPGESARFPRENGENHYYHARETDAVPLQAEFDAPQNEQEGFFRGASIVQREKFLFYRGVGTFPPPINIRAMGGDKVRVMNAAGGRVTGLVLVTVHEGHIGFRPVEDLEGGAEAVATLPETNSSPADLAENLVKSLTAAGLYEKEARAMVKTWDAAWFREEGTRLLYLVPRARTDELLPLTIDPKPMEIVRVLVGRHDFLTPEQETVADRQMARVQAAQAELAAAEKVLSGLGRFSSSARQLAANRLEAKAAQK